MYVIYAYIRIQIIDEIKTLYCSNSPRFTSPRFTSPRFTSPRFTSPRFTSPRFTSPRFTSPRFTSPRFTSPVQSSPVQSTKYHMPAERAKKGFVTLGYFWVDCRSRFSNH